MLLAILDSPALEGLQRPATLSIRGQVPVQCLKIGGMILNLQRSAAEGAADFLVSGRALVPALGSHRFLLLMK